MAFKIGEEKYSDKPLTEQETRKRFLRHAERIGSKKEMLLLFKKIEDMMRVAKNDSERKDIAKLGAVEAFNLLGSMDGVLTVNGELVVDKRSDEEKSKIIL